MRKVVLMVEGNKDEDQINGAFRDFGYMEQIKCLITEGTKVNNRIRAEIEDYQREGYNVYILSDPDEAGDNLARMIQRWYPDIPRLDVELDECAYYTGKKFKAGIEYSSHDYLRELICPLIGVTYKRKESPICWD